MISKRGWSATTSSASTGASGVLRLMKRSANGTKNNPNSFLENLPNSLLTVHNLVGLDSYQRRQPTSLARKVLLLGIAWRLNRGERDAGYNHHDLLRMRRCVCAEVLEAQGFEEDKQRHFNDAEVMTVPFDLSLIKRSVAP
jgi:hypothetical protein